MIHGLPVIVHAKAHMVYSFPLEAWLCTGEQIQSVGEVTIQMVEGGYGAAAPTIVGTPVVSVDKTAIELELRDGMAPADCVLTLVVETDRKRPSDNQGNRLAANWPILVRS